MRTYNITKNLNTNSGRNKYSIPIGTTRNIRGSANRIFQYCRRTTDDPFYCMFGIVKPSPPIRNCLNGYVSYSYTYTGEGIISEAVVKQNLPVYSIADVLNVNPEITIIGNTVYVEIITCLYELPSYPDNVGISLNSNPDIVTFINANTNGITFTASSNCPFAKIGSQFKGVNNLTIIQAKGFRSLNYFTPYFLLGTSLSGCFQNCTNFNSNISGWDTTNVIDMSSMFNSAIEFNQNIGNWNTSNVTTMSQMFKSASKFNQPIGTWNTSKVTSTYQMFEFAISFNQSMSYDSLNNYWNTSNITNMAYMFSSNDVFNQYIGNWNTSNVTNMSYMFYKSISFNNGENPLTSSSPLLWNTSKVENMQSMFYDATSFNQPINYDSINNYWNTSNVTNMINLFALSRFNQNIGEWNVSKVTNMSSMFRHARLFNNGETGTQDIAGNATNAYYTNTNSVLTCPDSTIISGLSVDDVIIITTGPITLPSIIYTSKISTIPNSTTLILIPNYGLNIGTVGAPIITSIKKQVAGSAPLNWTTTSLPDMQYMFSDATYFNQRVNSFNIGNATHMFSSTTIPQFRGIFNNGQIAGSNDNTLRNWNTVNTGSIGAMFLNSAGFNQNISNWNISNVVYTGQMFQGTRVYNNGQVSGVPSDDSSLNSWNTSSLLDIQVMFNGAIAFNQNISSWDVSKVTTMDGTFSGATLFNNGDTVGASNKPLTSWYAPKCVDFSSMFRNAVSFNQNISNLVDTSTLTDPSGCSLDLMFNSASLFNNGETNTIPTITPNTCTSVGSTLNCPGATLSSHVTVGDALLIPNLSRTSAFVVTIVNSNIQLTISPSIGTNVAGQIFNVQKVFPITSTLPSVTPSTSFYLNSTKTLTCPGATFISSPAINMNDTLWVVTTSTIYITTVQSITNETNLVVTGFGIDLAATGIINIQKPPPGTSPLNWNTSNVVNMNNMFRNAALFNQSLISFNTSNVTNIGEMFRTTSSFNQSLSNFDTRNVSVIGGMFNEAKMFNQPINTNGIYWNTSNITSMSSMFQAAQIFNQSLSLWNTSKVTNMTTMFYNAYLFNEPLTQDINGIWDVSEVTNMNAIFQSATSFNQNLNSWNVSKVSNMNNAFFSASIFNNGGAYGTSSLPLTWYAPSCTNFNGMFSREPAFNQPLPYLVDTSGVTICDLGSMFLQISASTFNQNLNSWNVSNVINMAGMFQSTTSYNNGNVALIWYAPNCLSFASMFQSASAFNQQISSLVDTSGVTLPVGCNLNSMFQSATQFNQNLNTWNVSRATSISLTFSGATAFNNGSLINDGANTLTWYAPNCTTFASMFSTASSFNQQIPFLVDTSGITNCVINSMFSVATNFNNGQTGTQDISGTLASASYTVGTSTLSYPGATFISSGLTTNDVLIIATGTIVSPAIIYASQIQRIISDTSLVLLTPHTNTIASGITSIKKQLTGSADLNSWNTTNVTNMANMFNNAYYFNQNISNWNVSKVISMLSMFSATTGAFDTIFNNGQLAGSSGQPLNWTASRCTTFASMFLFNSGFNQPIPTLVDVSCTTLTSMFVGTSVFNQNVSSWKTDNVTAMDSVFSSARAFNNGETGRVDISGNPLTSYYSNANTTLSSPGAAFNSQLTLNDVLIIATPTIIYTSKILRIISDSSLILLTSHGSNIGTPALPVITSIKKQVAGTADLSWNTANVTTMASAFTNAHYFNQNISNWNVSKVVFMNSMFPGGTTALRDIFNNGQLAGSSGQPLNWTASRCTNFTSMFSNTSGFNQPIPTLVDISGGLLTSMFQGASVFNQNVSDWKTDNVTTLASVFSGAGSFNNGQTGTQNIRGTPSLASYSNLSPYTLTCSDASFTLDFLPNDVIIITTGTAIYSSVVASITNDTQLNLLLAYAIGINIPSPLIISIKKQVAGTADLSWNTTNVTNIANMFQNATYFNQRLPWNTRKVTNVTSVFVGTAGTFINLFNNGQIITGTTQKLYTTPTANTWDFSGNTVSGGTGGSWRNNSRLITVTGNGVTANPVLT
jgi:surface protein